MEHWLSYSLSDFLLFAPETYFRLFERYNQALWPLQIGVVGITLAMLWLAWRQRRLRLLTLFFALAWLLVAWAFFWERYRTINWAAGYFALGCLLQAALLLGLTLRPSPTDLRGWRCALGLLAFAILLQPLIGPLSGRTWQGIELVGLAPDPTALATLGFALLLSGWRRWFVVATSLSWLAIGAATAWAMEWTSGLLAPAVALAALLLGYPLEMRRSSASP